MGQDQREIPDWKRRSGGGNLWGGRRDVFHKQLQRSGGEEEFSSGDIKILTALWSTDSLFLHGCTVLPGSNTQLFLSKSKIHNSKSPFPKIQLTDSLIAEDVCVCVFGLYPWQHNNTHTHTHVRKWQWHRSFPNGATVTSWNLPPMSTLTVWNRTRRDGWGQALLSVSTHKHVWAACVRRVGRDGVSAFSSG